MAAQAPTVPGKPTGLTLKPPAGSRGWLAAAWTATLNAQSLGNNSGCRNSSPTTTNKCSTTTTLSDDDFVFEGPV